MAQKEWALKNKKKTDKASKKSVADGSAGGAIPVDDEVWDVPSDDEPPREPASKVPKTDNDKEGKQAAREPRSWRNSWRWRGTKRLARRQS